jgi:integrase/recombinase XerD
MIVKEAITAYLKHLQTLGRSFYTVKGSRSALGDLSRFLDQEQVASLEDLTSDLLLEYQEDLAFRFTDKGKSLALRSQAQILGVVKGFIRFLKDQDYLVHDPGQGIRLPKKPHKLPKAILSPKEVKQMLEAPDIQTNRGYRNRIVLEILYDTAIRRAEASSIKVTDLDLESGFIRIQGKGDKERVVPFSKRVCELVKNYLLMVRPSFVQGEDDGHLFLNRWGQKMGPMSIWGVVKTTVKQAGIRKSVSTHTFRHTCATHMLRNGAPIRHLQEMLGHESLESTQIYTRVTINDLKKIHAKYHPSEQKTESRSQKPEGRTK